MDPVEAASTLRADAAALQAAAAEGEASDKKDEVEQLQAVAKEAGKAWSGSWLGYQSRVYYKDFQVPPPGVRFSSEWGFMNVFSPSTHGDWEELTFDDAVAGLYGRAGNPDLKEAVKNAAQVRKLFEDMRADIVSVLTALSRKDEFLDRLAHEVETLAVLAEANVVRAMTPSGTVMSRDAQAMGEGFQTPPHIAVLATTVEVQNSYIKCGELARVALKAAAHMERTASTKPTLQADSMRVFIGHGASPLWRELKDFIHDRLSLPWDEFNRVPAAGFTNIARLSEMLDSARIAFLVLTAEDEDSSGSLHARQNVIHEAGLFQGRLGFSRAIVLLEEGCEEFSNIAGLGQIRFPQGNISAKFEEVRLVLEREGFVPPA